MQYDSNQFITNGNGGSVIYKDNNMKSSHGAGIPQPQSTYSVPHVGQIRTTYGPERY